MSEYEDDFEDQSPDTGSAEPGDQGVQGEAGTQGEDGVSADPHELDAINARLDKNAEYVQTLAEIVARLESQLAHVYPIREPDSAAVVTGGTAFAYLVTKDGGSAGTNKSSACSFTYALYDAVNDPGKASALATGVSLTGYGNGFRGLNIALAEGTQGGGYVTTGGTYILTWVDERPASEQDCM